MPVTLVIHKIDGRRHFSTEHLHCIIGSIWSKNLGKSCFCLSKLLSKSVFSLNSKIVQTTSLKSQNCLSYLMSWLEVSFKMVSSLLIVFFINNRKWFKTPKNGSKIFKFSRKYLELLEIRFSCRKKMRKVLNKLGKFTKYFNLSQKCFLEFWILEISFLWF